MKSQTKFTDFYNVKVTLHQVSKSHEYVEIPATTFENYISFTKFCLV